MVANSNTKSPDITVDPKAMLNKYKQASEGIEGWFSRLSIVLWDILLQRQKDLNIRGNLLEIGAWHGKSASMLAIHTRQQEKFVIVDIEVRDRLVENVAKLVHSFKTDINLIKGNSFTQFDPDFANKYYRSMRWIHIDGDHSQHGIHNDLEIANNLLHPLGVIAVDDFLNERFPQISEATFEFILSHRHELAMVLCGGNKAYLIRPKFYDKYYDFLKKSLKGEAARRDLSVDIFDGTNNNYPCICARIP